MTIFGKEKIVIIGGGSSGLAAASRAKRAKSTLDITVLEKQSKAGVALCSLPLVIDGTISPEKAFIKPESYFTKELGINILTGCETISIERSKHSVTTESSEVGGKQIFPYDMLILALGLKPMLPNVKNFANKKNLFHINSLDETLRMLSYIDENKCRSAAIIGCGIHGLTLADSVAKRGLDIVIIENDPNPLKDYIEEIRTEIIKNTSDSGIKLISGCGRIEAVGKDIIDHIITDNGTFKTDLVIPATGYRPMNDLALDAGITCDNNGFIITDDFRMTNDFNILACGDCSLVKCIVTGKRIAFSSAVVAANTGYYAGLNASDTHKPFPGTTRTRIAKLGKYFFGRTGLTLSQAETEGYEILETIVYVNSKPSEIHEQKMILQMIFNRKNGRLLGAQAGGSNAVQSELDIASLALQNGMTAEGIADYEAAFIPHSSSLKHPLYYAARKALREL